MIINPKILGWDVPMLAPIGAVSFRVKEQEKGATIFFGLLKADEDGLTAIQRISKETGAAWTATTARPENMAGSSDMKGGYVAYDVLYEDGTFTGATAADQAAFELMRRVSALPTRAADTASLTLEQFLAKWKSPTQLTK
jgi:hypothetical protein